MFYEVVDETFTYFFCVSAGATIGNLLFHRPATPEIDDDDEDIKHQEENREPSERNLRRAESDLRYLNAGRLAKPIYFRFALKSEALRSIKGIETVKVAIARARENKSMFTVQVDELREGLRLEKFKTSFTPYSQIDQQSLSDVEPPKRSLIRRPRELSFRFRQNLINFNVLKIEREIFNVKKLFEQTKLLPSSLCTTNNCLHCKIWVESERFINSFIEVNKFVRPNTYWSGDMPHFGWMRVIPEHMVDNFITVVELLKLAASVCKKEQATTCHHCSAIATFTKCGCVIYSNRFPHRKSAKKTRNDELLFLNLNKMFSGIGFDKPNFLPDQCKDMDGSDIGELIAKTTGCSHYVQIENLATCLSDIVCSQKELNREINAVMDASKLLFPDGRIFDSTQDSLTQRLFFSNKEISAALQTLNDRKNSSLFVPPFLRSISILPEDDCESTTDGNETDADANGLVCEGGDSFEW